ncbi:MAG: nucleotidyltransferase family protein [Patescibacteria group bacterium]|jgi:NDP-sugar pyrophosphorylase family protein
MQTIIFAAGLSTRMRPYTDTCPKPMLSVDNQPMLFYIIKQLRDAGITDITITTHYYASVISGFFGDGKSLGVSIRYAHEDKLMDTAGSLRNIAIQRNEEVLAIGGNDYLPNLDIPAFVDFHRIKKGVGTIAFIETHPPHNPRNFGQGVLDVDSCLINFEEKPEKFISPLLHTTYQIYNPEVAEYIPKDVTNSIPRHLIPALLKVHTPVYGYLAPAPFLCVSTKEEYKWACENIKVNTVEKLRTL